MNISIALPAMAPQTTGHPASLPSDPAPQTAAQKVTPPSQGEASMQTDNQQPGGGQQQETAPPSAMQLKIMELLDQQAREMETQQDA